VENSKVSGLWGLDTDMGIGASIVWRLTINAAFTASELSGLLSSISQLRPVNYIRRSMGNISSSKRHKK
jgi:hypothetical protein